MSHVAGAWTDGWARVARAPAVLVCVVVLTMLGAVPFAFTLRATLATHLGASQAAQQAAAGVNYDWWQEFLSQASGVGATFSPRIVGFAATLDSLGAVADRRRETTALVGLLAAYVVVWTALIGGIVDRYARQRPTRAHGFAAASGTFFLRFLRLGVVSSLVYGWLFLYLHPWLFDERIADLTRGLDSERTAFAWRAAGYAVFGALVVSANVIFDYAKIRMVVEDRRSALGGLAAGCRFVWRHAAAVAGLYAANTFVFLGLVAVWALVAPGVPAEGPGMWAAFLLGQGFVVARLAAKLHFLASQTALFQASLAHAGYVASPVSPWPESAAVEAVARGTSSL